MPQATSQSWYIKGDFETDRYNHRRIFKTVEEEKIGGKISKACFSQARNKANFPYTDTLREIDLRRKTMKIINKIIILSIVFFAALGGLFLFSNIVISKAASWQQLAFELSFLQRFPLLFSNFIIKNWFIVLWLFFITYAGVVIGLIIKSQKKEN